MADLEKVTFRRIAAPAGAHPSLQLWEMVATTGEVFARAEIYVAPTQWGVRLADRAPALSDSDLLRLVAKLLVWDAGCTTDTVDVVLGRTHDHHALVRVGADYV
jgi:hypothetical protein